MSQPQVNGNGSSTAAQNGSPVTDNGGEQTPHRGDHAIGGWLREGGDAPWSSARVTAGRGSAARSDNGAATGGAAAHSDKSTSWYVARSFSMHERVLRLWNVIRLTRLDVSRA